MASSVCLSFPDELIKSPGLSEHPGVGACDGAGAGSGTTCTVGSAGVGSDANAAAVETQRERRHRLQRERNDTVVANGVNNTGV